MIIGVTGTYGAGKDVVAEYLIKKGFNHYSLSDEIREILKEKGIKETRDTLTDIANELRLNYGHDYLAVRVLGKLQRPAVITSIRNPKEIDKLKVQGKFILIHVDADREIRYKRTVIRSRTGDKMTFEEFIKKENKEISGEGHKQSLGSCFVKADHIIKNNDDLESLFEKVDSIIKKSEK